MNKTIQVVVFGLGHLGKFHCQKVKFCPSANLAMIVDESLDALQYARKEYPEAIVCTYKEWEVKAKELNLDAAIIATPTLTHLRLIKDMMENSLHIFCEKPLCQNLLEALSLEHLYSSYSKNGHVFQVGHIERYHSFWFDQRELIQKYINAGDCLINFKRFSTFKPRCKDVDVVADVMIHDLDLMLFLLKVMPQSVEAHGFKVCTQFLDNVTAKMNYPQGVVYLEANRDYFEEVRQLEIRSNAGTLVVDLLNNTYREITANQAKKESVVSEEKYLKRDHLLLEHQEFYQSITDSRSPMITFDDGLKALKLAEFIYQSIAKKTSVKIV